MIRSILLQNFQSHKKTLLEFSPGINCIIGASNQGKTSVLRGLNWCKDNRPSGDNYISHWNRDKKDKPIKSTYVKIINDTGIVERRKGFIKDNDKQKPFNGYILNNETNLEAVGQDVPEEVTKIFNLDEINIQKQMDAPFLLSESAGEVARFFNQTIRLDLIDRILSKVESKRRETNKDILRLNQESKDIENEIVTYNWLDDAEALVNKISRIEDSYNKNISSKELLINYIEEYEDKLEIINNLEVILSAVPVMNKIDNLAEALDFKIKKCSKLQNLCQQWLEQNSIIEGTADFNLIDKLIIKIDDFRKELFEKVKSLEKLNNLIEEYKIECTKIDDNNDELKDLMKQLPKNCPTCNKPLDKDEC